MTSNPVTKQWIEFYGGSLHGKVELVPDSFLQIREPVKEEGKDCYFETYYRRQYNLNGLNKTLLVLHSIPDKEVEEHLHTHSE